MKKTMFNGIVMIVVFIFALSACATKNPDMPEVRLNAPNTPQPVDQAVGVAVNVTLQWECDNPTKQGLMYDVYLSKTSDELIRLGKNLDSKNKTFVLPEELDYGTTYFWRVEVKENLPSGSRAIAMSEEWEFTTVAQPYTPPELPATPTPTDGATGVATSVTLSWVQENPDERTLTYDVYLGQASDVLDKKEENLTVEECTLTGLTYDTKYFWRVTVKDDEAVGARTDLPGEVWEFTTMVQPSEELQAPATPTPTDGATGVATSVTLSWVQENPHERTLTYDVYLGQASDVLDKIEENLTAEECTLTGLIYDTKYFWRVTVKDDEAIGARTDLPGEVWEFTTMIQPPDELQAPTTPNPTDGTTGMATSVTLSWTQENPYEKMLTYDVYLGLASNDLDKKEENLTAEEFTVTGLTYDTKYFWRVTVKDDEAIAPRIVSSSEVWEFTTMWDPLREKYAYDISINDMWDWPTRLVQYEIVFTGIGNQVNRLVLSGNGADREMEVTGNQASITDYLVSYGSENATLTAYDGTTLLWQDAISLPQAMEVRDISLDKSFSTYDSYRISLRLNYKGIKEINNFTDLNTGAFLSFRNLSDEVLESVPITFTGETTTTTSDFKIYVSKATTNGILRTDTPASLRIDLP